MKIGFNIKALKKLIVNNLVAISDYISGIEDRVTTLENSSTSGGSSESSLVECTMNLYNTSGTNIKSFNPSLFYDILFLNFSYYKTFENINKGMIGYNYIKLGSVELISNADETIKYKIDGTIPCYYKVGSMDSYEKMGLIRIYVNESNKNVIELIIDKNDIEIWTNVADLSTYIEIKGSGTIKALQIA